MKPNQKIITEAIKAIVKDLKNNFEDDDMVDEYKEFVDIANDKNPQFKDLIDGFAECAWDAESTGAYIQNKVDEKIITPEIGYYLLIELISQWNTFDT